MQRLGISGTTLYSLPSWLWAVNLFFNTKSNNIFFQKEALSLPFVDHHYVGYTILVLNRPQNRCFSSYLLATDPYGKKTIFRLRPDLEYAASQPSRHANWSTRSTSGALEKGRSMQGRRTASIRHPTGKKKKFKDILLTLLIVTASTTGHHHPIDVTSSLQFSVTPCRNLVFMSTIMAPAGNCSSL